MKTQLKTGFTLAEVLITLAIIGIIAAIVIPAVITSYQYKTVGVKLSKFQATIENAARAYVVSNDSFKKVTSTSTGGVIAPKDAESATNFLNEAVIYKGFYKPDSRTAADLIKSGLALTTEDKTQTEIAVAGEVPGERGGDPVQTGLIGLMKDNTKLYALPMDSSADQWETASTTERNMKMLKKEKIGKGAFILVFDPAVSGLPRNIHRGFEFVVTELGYMFPAADDDCLWSIYNADWNTKSDLFKEGSACYES